MAKGDIKPLWTSDHHPVKHLPDATKLSYDIQIVGCFYSASNKTIDCAGRALTAFADGIDHLLVEQVGKAGAAADLDIQCR